ncbi:MAG: hypothetical protein ACXIU8_04785 [Alkalilacustris sp.]
MLPEGWLGPTVSGMLIALPVKMVFVAAGVLRRASRATIRWVMVVAARGTASVALFLFTLPAWRPVGMAPLSAVLAASAAAVALALARAVGLRARTPDT